MDETLKTLWFQIDQTHSRYIESDASNSKYEYERKLEGLVQQYLSIVPHEFKFRFSETYRILKHSILVNKENFSIIKLANAWSAISRYANNLLSQPWRKEFLTIRLYSGYYKHEIESVLIGGSLMLELMGYKPTIESHMVLHEAFDGDKVRMVALDALIAKVECLILRMIFDDVSKQLNSYSWEDILECRESLVGPPELISRKYIHRCLQYRPASCSYLPPQICNGYRTTMPPPSSPFLHPKPVCSGPGFAPMNGYYCGQYGHNTLPNYNYSCSAPSGNLIDFDVPTPTYNRNTSDSYSRSLSSSDDHHHGASSRGTNEDLKTSWGYVLDKLDQSSSGSSNPGKITEALKQMKLSEEASLHDEVDDGRHSRHKRTLDRHRQSERERSQREMADRERERTHSERIHRENERDRKYSEREKHYRDVEREKDRIIREERERQLKEIEREKIQLEKLQRELEQVRREKGEASRRDIDSRTEQQESKSYKAISPDMKYEEPRLGETREASTSSQPLFDIPASNLRVNLTPEPAPSHSNDRWSCEFCTYANESHREVCEMCGKSKNIGVEMKPLESGGRQCPQCTLVNDKGVLKCVACDHDLKKSPTYV